MPFDNVTGEKMLDPKVAENARLAWENFVLQVSRMESRMLTAMAEKIDRQWADMVAETPKPRHDEPTCCSERQVTECRSADAKVDETSQADVGDGWRWVEPGELLCKGDQFLPIWSRDDYGNPWRETSYCAGLPVAANEQHTYRRRVTSEAPALSPAAVSAMCQRNERDALLKKIATLRSEAEQQQEINLHAGLEVERLKAEVERLRLTEEDGLRSILKRLGSDQ